MNALLGLSVVETLFRHSPPFTAGRVMGSLLRRAGVRVGRTCCFWGMPTFAGDVHGLLSIGEGCGFNVGVHFELEAEIRFEDHVSVGHEVMFLTRTFDTTDPTRRAVPNGGAPIHVGEGAWIGARSTILPGTQIGAGAVIAAGSVVSGVVPPHTLLSGKRKISLAKWR